MAVNPEEEVVLTENKGHVRLITLNQPRRLNVISPKVVYLLAQNMEQYEKDEDAKLVIIKGVGRAFSAGGDLKMFYDGRESKDSCLEVVYRFYWLCYHNYTYKKPQGVCKLCALDQDFVTSRSTTDELGWRFWQDRCPPKSSVQQLRLVERFSL